MILKEMEYVVEFKQPELLAFGFHRHRRYYVLSFGHHPCCYIEALKRDKSYFGKSYYPIDLDVHGGLSYSASSIPHVSSSKGWFLGWDYTKCNDYTGVDEYYCGGNMLDKNLKIVKKKKWTTEELEQDCIDVINQIEPTFWK